MKMYTNESQTAKLIELGFEKPKGWCVEGISSRLIMYKHKEDDEDFNYSVGELLSFLPTTITAKIWWGIDKGQEGVWGLRIDTGATDYGWDVSYERDSSAYLHREGCTELIDALYDMILKLKEERVI